MNWIELHTDTSASEQLSFLDGAQIVSLCAKNGCTAVACTDRNSILSYLPMEREAERRGHSADLWCDLGLRGFG